MTRPLLTISEFARAVDLSPSALRYYHEAGLLPPTEIDGRTGYRYYTRELERRALVLARLREIGVPIEMMRQVVAGQPEQAAVLLEAHAASVRSAAERTAEVVADLAGELRAGASCGDVALELDGPELATALRRVVRAAGDDPDSGLGVVLLDVRDHAVHVVATDRHWLTCWEVAASGVPSGERRCAIPIGAVGALADRLDREQRTTLTLRDGVLEVAGQPVPTVPDRFPAYRVLIDALPLPTARACVARADLLAAVEAAQDQTVRLQLTADRLAVSTLDGVGTRLAAVIVGEPLTVGFAAPLLTRILAGVGTHQVSLSFAGPGAAMRLSAPEQPQVLVLAMPTRLDT